jgi:hypothetical protein
MVYIDFRVRTPDEADEDLDDLPTEETVVMSLFVARRLADELDRLLRNYMGPPGRPHVEEAREPDVRADIDDVRRDVLARIFPRSVPTGVVASHAGGPARVLLRRWSKPAVPGPTLVRRSRSDWSIGLNWMESPSGSNPDGLPAGVRPTR